MEIPRQNYVLQQKHPWDLEDMKRAPRWLALIVAVLGILANLPGMILGGSLLGSYIRLRVSGAPYFKYEYLPHAVLWLLVSALGIAAAGVTIWRRSSYDFFPVFSLIVGFVCLIVLPNASPRFDQAEATTKLLGHADHSLSDWDESHGMFPSNERELREALALRPLREHAIFFRNGNPIPYDVRVITNAVGPVLEPLPPDPGTVIYAVSSDQKEYWLVVTTLRNPVGGPVLVHHAASDYDAGEALVMNRKHHSPGERYQPFIE